MDELVEKVARAMCAEMGYEWGSGLLMPEDYRWMAEAAVATVQAHLQAEARRLVPVTLKRTG